MDYIRDWIQFFIALFSTAVQWLGSMQILGVSVLWIVIAAFFLGIMIRSMIIKP